MATENLKVKITADAAQAKAEIGKFKTSLKETVGSAEKAASSALKLKAALGALATVKVAKAMLQNAINIAATGDAIKDNAQKVFMGTTAYQEWGYVLQQNGVEIGALKMGMRKFSQEVASGSASLARYGITATDVDTAFSQAVATIQNMSTETEKIAAATELFGTRALELFPILNLTNAETQSLMATYRAIGGTMSNELIAASDVCTDSITEMRAAWGGLRNLLAAYVIPVVTKVVQWLTVAIAKIRILLAAILGVKETFGGGGKTSMPKTTQSIATNTGKTAGNLKKATRHAKELKRTLMGIDELSKLAEKATAAAASGGSGGGGGASVPTVSVGDPGTFDGIISEDTLSKIQTFQEKIDGIKDKLNGAYLILKGFGEIAMGNPVQGFKDLKDGIEKLFPGIKDLGDKWDALKTKLKEKVENAIGIKIPTWDDVKAGWEALKTKFSEVITGKTAIKIPTWDEVKASWEALKTKFAEVIQGKVGVDIPTWDSLKSKWETFKANFASIGSSVGITLPTWDSLKRKWSDLTDKFSAGSVSIGIKIPKWKDLKTKWNNLKKKFKGKTVKIGLKFSVAASDLKKWINKNVIAKINDKFSKVPILKNHLIPKLASGGVLTAPTTALMAEYPGARSNPEIATPQSLMAETMRDVNGDLVSAFAQMTRQVIAAIEEKDMSVKIGDETIARSAQRGNTAYRNRTGKPLLSI